ncbi:MAG TPA: branched-chain amino acid ABC transporter permease [Xanthobacteraceae bacterium]|nr:branched-chain amino acid ABC transporter permease [Xanthobacteraceae bacterium]
MPTAPLTRTVPWAAVTRRGVLGWIGPGLLVLALLFPAAAGAFYLRLAIEALLLGAIALSVDILLGFAGLLSLGQAMYFGLAAYLTALCYLHLTQSFWLVAAIVIAAVALVAVLLGAVAIRAKGVYFALITFGAAEIAGKVVHNTRALGGSDGLIGIPVPSIGLPGFALPLRNDLVFYYVVLVAVTLAFIGVRRLLATPFGSVLSAIRDNAIRVPYLGYNPFWYKLVAYLIAAEVAALGGLFYPLLRGFVGPDLFGFDISTQSVVMALVGGIGTLIGPLVGGVVVTLLQSVLGSYTERHLFVLGLVFILFVRFLPGGLFGLLRRDEPP